MFAFFHMSGTIPSVRDRLNIVVITGAKSNEKFLQNQQGTVYHPDQQQSFVGYLYYLSIFPISVENLNKKECCFQNGNDC